VIIERHTCSKLRNKLLFFYKFSFKMNHLKDTLVEFTVRVLIAAN